MKSLNLVFVLLIPFLTYSQDFTLTGDFKGENTERLVLLYIGGNGKNVRDTLKVEDGKFKSSGDIKGTQRVMMYGNIKSNATEDPNFVYFFLEPGNIKIKLEENNFKNMEVIGSASQREYKLIENKIKPIIIKLDSLSKNRTEDSRNLVLSELDKIQRIQLNYAIKNPGSPISPYLLSTHKRQLPLDSVRAIYEKFSVENKESKSGKDINDLINKRIVLENDIAPNFNVKDISGNSISLDTYKGKYLLLDFWADWCKPCIEKFPEVKSLIRRYKNQGLEVLFVSFDKTKDDWKESVKKHDITDWDHTFIGLDNLSKETISYKFDIQPIPAYILIGPEGRVLGRYANASKEGQNFEDLVNKLNTLMK